VTIGREEKHAALRAEIGALEIAIKQVISPGYGFVLVVAKIESEDDDAFQIEVVGQVANLPEEACLELHRGMLDEEIAAPIETVKR
jgi:hypothetical protein